MNQTNTLTWNPLSTIAELERRKTQLQAEASHIATAIDELRKVRSYNFGTGGFTGIEMPSDVPTQLDTRRESVQRFDKSEIRDILYRKVLRANRRKRLSTNEVVQMAERAGLDRDNYKDETSFKNAIYGQLSALAEKGAIRRFRPGALNEGVFWSAA